MNVIDVKQVPLNTSSDAIWIGWHTALKRNFGKKEANYLFQLAWEKRGSSYANTSALMDYAKKNDLIIESNVLASITNVAGNVFDFFGDIFKMGEYTAIALVIIILLTLGIAGYNIAKNPAKSAKLLITKGVK